VIDFAELALRARREEKARDAALAVAVAIMEGRQVVVVSASKSGARELYARVRELVEVPCDAPS